MGKKSRVILIFTLILVFGISGAYSNIVYDLNTVYDLGCKKIGYPNDIIFIPTISQIEKNYEYLMIIDNNKIKLFDNDLRERYTQDFGGSINSVQLLENNKPNIFLVATDEMIYLLDKELNKNYEFSLSFEIKKVIAVWDNDEESYSFIVQSDRSIYRYSNGIREELWKYPRDKNFEEEILSLSVTYYQSSQKFIIFGNTQNEFFLIEMNGAEIAKSKFSKVLSMHPLFEGIAVNCYTPNNPLGKDYVLKIIRFDKPNNIIDLYESNEPLNAITSGSCTLNNPNTIFFQEGTELIAINLNGMVYSSLIELNSQIKKIIIEELDQMKFHYEAPWESGTVKHEECVNEIVLVCENEIIFCTTKLFYEKWEDRERKIIEIGRYYKEGLDNFFIPEGQTNFPKKAFCTVAEDICMVRLMDNAYNFNYYLDRINEFIKKEDYRLTDWYLQFLKEKEQLMELYGYQSYINEKESKINEGVEEYRQKADQTFSQAEQEIESGNYSEALNNYYSSLKDYKKSGPNEKVTEAYKQTFCRIEELYGTKKIEDYKIEICSFLYKIFDSKIYDYTLYPWWDDISDLTENESLNEEFREDLGNFETNHFEAFKSTLEEIEADANKNRENGNLISARDKYSALIEPYSELLQDEQKVQDLESKVNELDSEIQEKERNKRFLIVSVIVVFVVIIYYFQKSKFSKPKEKEEKIEEELSEEEIRANIEKYEKKCKHAIYFISVICAILAFASASNEYLYPLPMAPIVLICGVFLFIKIWEFIKNYRLKEKLETQIQENEEKSLREFFSNPETLTPNFIAVVGDEYKNYREHVREFVRTISSLYFGEKSRTTSVAKSYIFGEQKRVDIATKPTEIKERDLIKNFNKVTDVDKFSNDLLLIGFTKDNTIIKDLVDQGLSKINWETSKGDFEFIPDAFVEGKDAIICSGQNALAILAGLEKISKKLKEEESKDYIEL